MDGEAHRNGRLRKMRRTSLTLSAIIIAALLNQPAHADGLILPPPPPSLYSLPGPAIQGPPSQSCLETAIQLAYQTGSRAVGNAAAEACRVYAPVRFPHAYYG